MLGHFAEFSKFPKRGYIYARLFDWEFSPSYHLFWLDCGFWWCFIRLWAPKANVFRPAWGFPSRKTHFRRYHTLKINTPQWTRRRPRSPSRGWDVHDSPKCQEGFPQTNHVFCGIADCGAKKREMVHSASKRSVRRNSGISRSNGMHGRLALI